MVYREEISLKSCRFWCIISRVGFINIASHSRLAYRNLGSKRRIWTQEISIEADRHAALLLFALRSLWEKSPSIAPAQVLSGPTGPHVPRTRTSLLRKALTKTGRRKLEVGFKRKAARRMGSQVGGKARREGRLGTGCHVFEIGLPRPLKVLIFLLIFTFFCTQILLWTRAFSMIDISCDLSVLFRHGGLSNQILFRCDWNFLPIPNPHPHWRSCFQCIRLQIPPSCRQRRKNGPFLLF